MSSVKISVKGNFHVHYEDKLLKYVPTFSNRYNSFNFPFLTVISNYFVCTVIGFWKDSGVRFKSRLLMHLFSFNES